MEAAHFPQACSLQAVHFQCANLQKADDPKTLCHFFGVSKWRTSTAFRQASSAALPTDCSPWPLPASILRRQIWDVPACEVQTNVFLAFCGKMKQISEELLGTLKC